MKRKTLAAIALGLSGAASAPLCQQVDVQLTPSQMAQGRAALPEYTMTIAARPVSVPSVVPRAMDMSRQVDGPLSPATKQSSTLPSLTGHIYILLGVKTATGVNEQTFGFYPNENGKGLIKGPGALRSEARCKPDEECGDPHFAMSLRNRAADASRIGNTVGVTISEQMPISKDQYNTIIQKTTEWSHREYNLIDSNCIAFVAEAVRAAGYEPPSNFTQLPTSYIAELSKAISNQNEARQLAKRTQEAEQQAREAKNKQFNAEHEAAAANAEAKRQKSLASEAQADRDSAQDRVKQLEAERRAQNAALAKQENDRRLANTIPTGWAQCTCPAAHSNLGRIINGQRWHPDYGNNCPR